MMNEPPKSPPTFSPGVVPGYVPGPPQAPPVGSLPPPTSQPADLNLYGAPVGTGPALDPFGQPIEHKFDASGERIRPWWGLGDVFLGIAFILAFAVIGTIVAVIVAVATGDIDFDADNFEVLQDDLATSAVIIVIAGGAQQLGQFIWPLIVAKWKGFGAATDFGFRFKPIDLAWGVGTGFAALVGAGLVGSGLAWLLGVNSEDADNTAFLSDNSDSPWIWGLIAITVIGAPFSEELLFRGLLLRAIEKRSNWIAGLIGSSIIFMLVHYQPMSFSELSVLFAAIGTAGAIFGATAIKTGRLAAPIIGHMLFNAVAVMSVLLT